VLNAFYSQFILYSPHSSRVPVCYVVFLPFGLTCNNFFFKCQKLKHPSCKLKNVVSEFGEEVFKVDDSVLFFQLCECKVNNKKKFNIIQHLKTDKHIKATKRHQNQIEKKQ